MSFPLSPTLQRLIGSSKHRYLMRHWVQQVFCFLEFGFHPAPQNLRYPKQSAMLASSQLEEFFNFLLPWGLGYCVFSVRVFGAFPPLYTLFRIFLLSWVLLGWGRRWWEWKQGDDVSSAVVHSYQLAKSCRIGIPISQIKSRCLNIRCRNTVNWRSLGYLE